MLETFLLQHTVVHMSTPDCHSRNSLRVILCYYLGIKIIPDALTLNKMSVARKEWPAVQSHEKVTQLHSNSLFMCICPFLYRHCAVLISFYNLFKLFKSQRYFKQFASVIFSISQKVKGVAASYL